MYYVEIVGFVIASYLLGNISPSILISRYFYGFDIRTKGSGNAGTTNVLRVLGWKAAAGTLAIDVLKGFVAVYITVNFCDDIGGMLAFVAVCLGHIYPVFFRFKGGKGVATALGAIWALNWPSAFACMLVALLILAISHKMSLASLSAAVSYPLLTLFYYPNIFPSAVLIAIVIIYTHRSNIKLLLKGEEKSLSVGSSKVVAKFGKAVEPAPEALLTVGENCSIYFPPLLSSEEPKDFYEHVKEPKLGEKKRKIAVLGSGALAYALGDMLSHHGHPVMLFAEKEEADRLKEERTAPSLPGILLSKKIKYTSNYRTLAGKRDFVILAMNLKEAEAALPMIKKYLSKDTILINAISGLTEEGKTTDKWLASEVENPVVSLAFPVDVLSLVQNEPSTLYVYGSKKSCRKKVLDLFTGLGTRALEQKDAKGCAYLGTFLEAYTAAAVLRGGSKDDSFFAIAREELLSLAKALGLKEETVSGPSGLGALFFLREEAAYAATAEDSVAAKSIIASVLKLAEEKKVDLPLLKAVSEAMLREEAMEEEISAEASEEAALEEEISAKFAEETGLPKEMQAEPSENEKDSEEKETSPDLASLNRERAAQRKIRYRKRRIKKRMHHSKRRNG